VVKITIMVEGEPDEVEIFLKHHNFGSTSQGETTSKNPKDSNSSSRESREVELAKIWALCTVKARQLLGQLAKHPDGYHRKQLDADLGIIWRQRNGPLGSITSALKKLGLPEEASPIIRDWGPQGLHYRMTLEDAAIIRKLAEQEGF
jgi:hypothetical protein